MILKLLSAYNDHGNLTTILECANFRKENLLLSYEIAGMTVKSGEPNTKVTNVFSIYAPYLFPYKVEHLYNLLKLEKIRTPFLKQRMTG